MAFVTKRGERWVVRWRDGGRGARAHSLTVSSERNALRLKVEIEDAIDRFGRYEPRRAGAATPLEVIVVAYVEHIARRLAPRTVVTLARQLELFRRFVGPVSAAEALSFARLSDYHTHLHHPETGRHQHERGPETIRKYIEAVEGLWAWAWGRQARGDFHGVAQPDSLELRRQLPPVRVSPTWAQMDAAICVSTGWHRQLYTVLRCTGLRVNQAMHLRWEDVQAGPDRTSWTLQIRPELGKSQAEKRGRTVPLAPVLVDELAGWGRREGWLIPCPRADRMARARDADRSWERADVPRALWDDRGHHAFRAGFQTELRRAGAELDAIKHLVGHSRGDVHERYVDPTALQLVAAVGLVPPIAEVQVAPAGRGLRIVRCAQGASTQSQPTSGDAMERR